MRKRWIGLAILLGLFAGGLTWFWVSGPLWRGAIRAGGQILSFSADGQTLYVADGVSAPAAGAGEPRLLRFDADTGKLVSVLDIKFPAPMFRVELSPNVSTLLIGGEMARGSGNVYFVHDASTGLKIAGPVEGVQHVNPGAFSNDGQWFWVYYGARQGAIEGLNVIEASTGKCVIRLREKDGESPDDLCFAADGSGVAVHWKKMPANASSSDFVQILDLPSGNERRQFALPNLPWQRVDKWLGNRLFAEVNISDGAPGKYFRRTFSFELTADPIGEAREEPLLSGHVNGTKGQTYWDDGPGWVAHLSLGSYEKTKLDEWLEWLGNKLGKKFATKSGLHQRIRFLDAATGQLRHELPTQLSYPCAISPDGKRVASLHPELGVEVWDAASSQRWPLPSAIGFATAGGVLLFGRWRRHRETCPATISC